MEDKNGESILEDVSLAECVREAISRGYSVSNSKREKDILQITHPDGKRIMMIVRYGDNRYSATEVRGKFK